MLKDPIWSNTTHFNWSSKRERIPMNHSNSILKDSTSNERVNPWMNSHFNGWIENNCVLESETMMLIGRRNKSERIRSSTLCLQESFHQTIPLHGLTSILPFVRWNMNSHVDQWIQMEEWVPKGSSRQVEGRNRVWVRLKGTTNDNETTHWWQWVSTIH